RPLHSFVARAGPALAATQARAVATTMQRLTGPSGTTARRGRLRRAAGPPIRPRTRPSPRATACGGRAVTPVVCRGRAPASRRARGRDGPVTCALAAPDLHRELDGVAERRSLARADRVERTRRELAVLRRRQDHVRPRGERDEADAELLRHLRDECLRSLARG